MLNFSGTNNTITKRQKIALTQISMNSFGICFLNLKHDLEKNQGDVCMSSFFAIPNCLHSINPHVILIGHIDHLNLCAIWDQT